MCCWRLHTRLGLIACLATTPVPTWGAARPDPGIVERLVPRPRWVDVRAGSARLSPASVVALNGDDPVAVGLDGLLADLTVLHADARGPAPRLARLVVRPGRGPVVEHDWQAREAYELSVSPDSVVVSGPAIEGRCHGVQTLRQLVRAAGSGPLPALAVRDWPALRWRGVSDDVSRGQAPARADFNALFEHLAYYKLNVYFLYLEDMARFRSAPSAGEGRGAFTPAELRLLVRAARARHVTVVPLFETVAHQPRLLLAPELARFAEWRPPSALRVRLGAWLWPFAPVLASWARLPDPETPVAPRACFALADPATPARVAQLVDEIAANVPSPFFHLGADEPAGLGAGASAAAVRRSGAGAVYARYLNHLVAHVADSLARTPIVYGDMLLADPDALRGLDRRAAVMDWEYDPDSTGAGLARLRAAGFRRLFACAGLWNWRALYPNTARASRNLAAMARAAVDADAEGFVVASWGDGGARCLRESNWSGFALGSELAWSGAPPRADFVAAFASAEHAGDPAAGAEAMTLVGGQSFGSLSYGQRMFDRAPDVRVRTPWWRTRMEGLASDMLVARAAAHRAMASARFHLDGLEALDNAAACLQFAAARELTLDSLARRLGGAPLSSLEPGVRARSAASLAALRDSVVAARVTYSRLWRMHARPQGLDAALAPMDRQARACDALAARLAGSAAPARAQEPEARASRTN